MVFHNFFIYIYILDFLCLIYLLCLNKDDDDDDDPPPHPPLQIFHSRVAVVAPPLPQ